MPAAAHAPAADCRPAASADQRLGQQLVAELRDDEHDLVLDESLLALCRDDDAKRPAVLDALILDKLRRQVTHSNRAPEKKTVAKFAEEDLRGLFSLRVVGPAFRRLNQQRLIQKKDGHYRIRPGVHLPTERVVPLRVRLLPICEGKPSRAVLLGQLLWAQEFGTGDAPMPRSTSREWLSERDLLGWYGKHTVQADLEWLDRRGWITWEATPRGSHVIAHVGRVRAALEAAEATVEFAKSADFEQDAKGEIGKTGEPDRQVRRAKSADLAICSISPEDLQKEEREAQPNSSSSYLPPRKPAASAAAADACASPPSSNPHSGALQLVARRPLAIAEMRKHWDAELDQFPTKTAEVLRACEPYTDAEIASVVHVLPHQQGPWMWRRTLPAELIRRYGRRDGTEGTESAPALPELGLQSIEVTCPCGHRRRRMWLHGDREVGLEACPSPRCHRQGWGYPERPLGPSSETDVPASGGICKSRTARTYAQR